MQATYNVQILTSHSSCKPKLSGTGIFQAHMGHRVLMFKYLHCIVRPYVLRVP